jgi:hypothetical protein
MAQAQLTYAKKLKKSKPNPTINMPTIIPPNTNQKSTIQMDSGINLTQDIINEMCNYDNQQQQFGLDTAGIYENPQQQQKSQEQIQEEYIKSLTQIYDPSASAKKERIDIFCRNLYWHIEHIKERIYELQCHLNDAMIFQSQSPMPQHPNQQLNQRPNQQPNQQHNQQPNQQPAMYPMHQHNTM